MKLKWEQASDPNTKIAYWQGMKAVVRLDGWASEQPFVSGDDMHIEPSRRIGSRRISSRPQAMAWCRRVLERLGSA